MRRGMKFPARRQNECGASAVEFALILVPLILLLFGAVEFGIMFYDKAVITNASREGARQGTIFINDNPRLPYTEIATTVNNYTSTYLITFGDATGVSVTTTPSGTTELNPGDMLTVDVRYQYDYLLLPGFIPGLPNPIIMQAVTTMRAE